MQGQWFALTDIPSTLLPTLPIIYACIFTYGFTEASPINRLPQRLVPQTTALTF